LTPTARVAGVLVVIALAALVLPAWLPIAATAILIAAVFLDAYAVRGAPRIERMTTSVLSRGVPAALSINAVAPDARDLLLRQPPAPWVDVHSEPSSDGRGLRGEITATRRGRHRLPGVASASVGPLRLARFHHPQGADAELLVYPDLHAARRMALRLRQGRAARDGRLRRGPLGLGTEFESVRDYSVDDDVRQVNWLATARLGRPMSNQYRVEQDRDVVCVVDSGRLMAAPLGHRTLLDVALDATAALALAADELGDRCGAIAFDGQLRRVLAPRRLGGRVVVDGLFDLQASSADSDFELAFLRVGGARRAFVLVFTDLIDEAAARSLMAAVPMLARRHAVVVASVSDPALASAAAAPPEAAEDPYEALAALTVLQTRARAALSITRTGAELIEAPPDALAQRCLHAYLRAKARARF
jgi:uncharacterized protein (DUF58 family)